MGIIPARLISPSVGLMPTSPFADDGQTTEPSVSVPTASGAKIGRHRRARSRTRAARIAVERIRISGQPATPAPSADRMAGANVRPLAQIGFAQNHRARLAQLLRHKRIPRRTRPDQRQRPGGSLHLVGRVDVVLDQHRNPVQRPARAFALRSLSSASAIARASGFTSITLLTDGP